MDIFNVNLGYLIYYDVDVGAGYRATCKQIFVF